jgi:uncharacterized integral membrane protein
MSNARTVALAAAILLVIVVVLQNTETSEVRILFARIAMPRALLLALTAGLGIVIGLLLATKRKRGGSS